MIGRYLNPPEKAIVFSVDEKSQIQALDRTQPGLPLKPGKTGTLTHDYKRHGPTTLFAALNVHEGTIIGACLPRHDEFLRFFRKLDRLRLPCQPEHHGATQFDLSAQPVMDPFRHPQKALSGIMKTTGVRLRLDPNDFQPRFTLSLSSQTGPCCHRPDAYR